MKHGLRLIIFFLPQFVLQLAILYREAGRKWSGLHLKPFKWFQLGSSFFSVVVTVSSLTLDLPIFLQDKVQVVRNKGLLDLVQTIVINVFVITPRLFTLALAFGCLDEENWRSGFITIGGWLLTYILFFGGAMKIYKWWNSAPSPQNDIELQAAAPSSQEDTSVIEETTVTTVSC